jgi:hypothetical protein
MLKHWDKLLNTDCIVVEIAGHLVYPIFRNASTSMFDECERKLVNQQISDCDNIHVVIRDPQERFRSGLNHYCQKNNLDLDHTWKQVEQDVVVDRHFSPQWIWLLHLSKYHHGTITIRPFSAVSDYCKTHHNKSNKEQVKEVRSIHRYVQQDNILLEYLGKSVNIQQIVRECKDGMS